MMLLLDAMEVVSSDIGLDGSVGVVVERVLGWGQGGSGKWQVGRNGRN